MRGGWGRVAAFDTEGQQVGIVFATASPFDTPGRMAELIAWYDAPARRGALHPLLAIGIFAVVFPGGPSLPGRQRPPPPGRDERQDDDWDECQRFPQI